MRGARTEAMSNKVCVFDDQRLKDELHRCNIKTLHALSIQSFVLGREGAQPHEVPNLPNAAYPLLQSQFVTTTSQLRNKLVSSDGTTVKLLIALQNGQTVESVIMRHNPASGTYAKGPRHGAPRATLCVSSQVGCNMGCSFCATGTMGLKGNLSAGEIVEQLVHASWITPIRNVVFMGMGEPLNNYQSVLQAVRTMTGPCFSISPSHITVSTVGVIPRLLSLHNDIPGVNLALSLHAPTQELRLQIVPAARAYKLSKLISAVDSHIAASNRKVFIEYIMIGDINDSEKNAHELGALLQGRQVVLNLIPYNPTDTKAAFRASSEHSLYAFQKTVREHYGVRTIVRREMGQDIAGACGQLVIGQQKAAHRKDADPGDIEELF